MPKRASVYFAQNLQWDLNRLAAGKKTLYINLRTKEGEKTKMLFISPLQNGKSYPGGSQMCRKAHLHLLGGAHWCINVGLGSDVCTSRDWLCGVLRGWGGGGKSILWLGRAGGEQDLAVILDPIKASGCSCLLESAPCPEVAQI